MTAEAPRLNFEQVLEYLKTLSKKKKEKVKEVLKENQISEKTESREEWLHWIENEGLTLSEEQIAEIEKAREDLSRWRS